MGIPLARLVDRSCRFEKQKFSIAQSANLHFSNNRGSFYAACSNGRRRTPRGAHTRTRKNLMVWRTPAWTAYIDCKPSPFATVIPLRKYCQSFFFYTYIFLYYYQYIFLLVWIPVCTFCRVCRPPSTRQSFLLLRSSTNINGKKI